jgi:hypothetical protein
MTKLENELNKTKSILLETYPNPFKNSIHIKVSSLSDQLLIMELYGLTGALISREEHFVKNNSIISPFSGVLGSLNVGFYFLKVNSGNELITLKLLKQ